MKAIYIDGLPTLGLFRAYIVEVENAGKTMMRIISSEDKERHLPTRSHRGNFVPYSDEVWKVCRGMKKQYDILWKMQLSLKDMAMKEIE